MTGFVLETRKMAPKNAEKLKNYENNEKSENIMEDNETTERSNDGSDNEIERNSPRDTDLDTVDKARIVNLSSIQNHPDTWKHSSIRNILTDYGMPHRQTGRPTDKAKKAKKTLQQGRPKKNQSFNEHEEDERQKAKREKNLQRYEDIQRLRSLYYKVYLEELKDKVEQQREQIRVKAEESDNKLRARQERERRENEKMKKKFHKHKLNHDDDFLRRIPKSDHYKIVALQDKLKSEGILKTQEDLDRFWTDIKDPVMLRRYLYIYKPFPLEPSIASRNRTSTYTGSISDVNAAHRSRASSTSHPAPPEPKPPIPEVPVLPDTKDTRPLSKIPESRESSRPVTREKGAESTEKGAELKTGRDKATSTPISERKKVMDPFMIAKMAAAELDRKCPQMELPPMACFTMDFGEKPADPEQVLAEVSADRRQKERKLFIKRLRRMYHLSRSNKASAQRILDQHNIVDDNADLCNPALSDVIAIDDISRDLHTALHSREPPSPVEDVRPWSRYLEVQRRRSILPIMEEEPSTRTTSATTTTSRASRVRSAEHTLKPVNVSPAPLSLRAMETSKVMEAKCMSTLWTNYLGAGHSKFTPVHT